MKNLISLFIGASVFAWAGQAAYAQSMRDLMNSYDKPAKIQHYNADRDSAENKPSMHYYKAPVQEAAPKTDEAPADAAEVEAKPQGLYLPPKSAPLTSLDSAVLNADEEAAKPFAYKTTGVVLGEEERFPPLKDLTEWPWLRELTYGPENPATRNAMDIMDRDLSKAPPLAMMWAAQHYYDTKQQDKALFFYLASRLRSSVDQARFMAAPKKADVNATEANIDTERMSGVGTKAVEETESYKSLAAYNNVAASIGRPILKYGLKHPDAYKKQLDAAMLWDFETPYEYHPAVADLLIDETQKDQWAGRYNDVRELYQKQMNKIIDAVKK